MNLHLWLIPLLPLLGAAINGLAGRHLPKRAITAIALGSTAASLGVALWVAAQFFNLPAAAIPHLEEYAPWIRAGDFSAGFGFYLDQLSMLMTLIVTGVGFLIHVYSVGYMEHEGGYYRFFSYLNLFMFFMLTLVLAGNYLLMFVGWEGVGLASYLLIGFFFRRDSAANAGKKAFIVNRVGDFGFLIGLFILIRQFNSLNYTEVFAAAARFPVETAGAGMMTAVSLLLLVGACGKSAQLPLYVWLPDAMEGPTPVSALIHAATMVTAGVYMIARSHVMFDRAPITLTVVAIIGCATALFAATIALVQNDIKRVLAYSTISQLGYMVMACGVAAYSAAMFHLMTHAFFKALLFLAAGSVIHALGGEQDMRRMGGLRKQIPWTFWTMTIATLAIAGAPGFSGFFSKDEILWRAFSSRFGGVSFWIVGLFTAFLTAFYMFRLWFVTFFGESRAATARNHGAAPAAAKSGDGAEVDLVVPSQYLDAVIAELKERGATAQQVETHGEEKIIHAVIAPRKMLYLETEIRDITAGQGKVTIRHAARETPGREEHAHPGQAHESPRIMLVPLVALAVLSVVGGWIGIPEVMGGRNHFERFLAPVFESYATGASESATALGQPPGPSWELLLTLAATTAGLAGFLLAWQLYWRRPGSAERIKERVRGLYDLLEHKYYVDELYDAAIVQPIIAFSTQVLWRGVDVRTIDAAVNESATGARGVSDFLRRMQSGNIRSYAGWVAAGAAAVAIYMVWVGVR
jgi:NADH-quinone oxidoreductase subunit L